MYYQNDHESIGRAPWWMSSIPHKDIFLAFKLQPKHQFKHQIVSWVARNSAIDSLLLYSHYVPIRQYISNSYRNKTTSWDLPESGRVGPRRRSKMCQALPGPFKGECCMFPILSVLFSKRSSLDTLQIISIQLGIWTLDLDVPIFGYGFNPFILAIFEQG